jgi:hypothetical protein
MRGLAISVLTAILLFVACDPFASAAPATAFNLQRQAATPFRQTNVATVLVFVGVDCPISNRYAPEVQRLSGQFRAQGIPFWMVYPDKDVSLSVIRKHAQEFSLGDHILWDPQHALVKLAHARITPEVAVFAHGQTLVYHGQIDDRYVALGTERPAPTRRYLEETLRALLNHQPVPTNQTQAIGCSIPD